MLDPTRTALERVVARLPGGGEARDGQRRMAEAVEQALRSGRHLVVRAGTGTGKSLGYLVPAVLWHRRVVVATATKALQDQLAGKDLPLLAAALGRRFSFAVLKGRSNYLCRQRLREAAAAGTQLELDGEPAGASAAGRRAEQVRQLLAWAATTTTGDRAELAEEPDQAVWSTFSVGADECPGPLLCPSGGDCFTEAAREAASRADVVVVNLHLLGADVAAAGELLPEHEALVVDEAHALEDVITESLGTTVGPARLRGFAALTRRAVGGGPRRGASRDDPVEALLEAAERLEEVVEARRGSRLAAGAADELSAVLELVSTRVERAERLLRGVEEQAQAGGGGDERRARLTRALAMCGKLRDDLRRLLDPGDDQVAWVEGGARQGVVVAPIDVSGPLAEHVFSRRPVVLASATVPPGLAERLGAEVGRTDELDVGSPFAYERNALLYCAAHLPDRRRPESEAAVHEDVVALVEAAGGRTLALFTSRAAMERAAAAVRPRVGVPVLCQGEGSKGALLEAFAGDPATCLFATMGFWQGVDVAGSTLSCVVIDRIPFPRPDDPLVAARRERAGRAAFRAVDLPRAASLLAQGAGRLIRSADDRGVVAVLDSRLATAPYRWDLVRALPPMRRTRHRAEAEAFLAEIRGEAEMAGAGSGAARRRPQ